MFKTKSNIYCEVAEKRIDPLTVFECASDFGHGAQNFFFGSVRGRNAGKEVCAVAYDAVPALAKKVLYEISNEVMARWGQDAKICVVHRIGKLLVGEISVAIGVSTRHRDESYQASRYVIEQIKIRAPIWKKEYYVNGETEWLKGHALCQHTHGDVDLHKGAS